MYMENTGNIIDTYIIEVSNMDVLRKKGISIGAGSVDKAGDILICRRMKLRGMWWSRKGADAVLSIRILVCNGEWDDFWNNYKAA